MNNMNKNKIGCIIDIETTGLDVKINSICSILCRLIDLDNHNNILYEDFSSLVNYNSGYKNEKIESNASYYNGITHNHIITAPSITEVGIKLFNWLNNATKDFELDKLFLIVFDSRFSCEFLKEFFKRMHINGVNEHPISYYNLFYPYPMDIASMFVNRIASGKEGIPRYFTLKNIYKQLTKKELTNKLDSLYEIYNIIK